MYVLHAFALTFLTRSITAKSTTTRFILLGVQGTCAWVAWLHGPHCIGWEPNPWPHEPIVGAWSVERAHLIFLPSVVRSDRARIAFVCCLRFIELRIFSINSFHFILLELLTFSRCGTPWNVGPNIFNFPADVIFYITVFKARHTLIALKMPLNPNHLNDRWVVIYPCRFIVVVTRLSSVWHRWPPCRHPLCMKQSCCQTDRAVHQAGSRHTG